MPWKIKVKTRQERIADLEKKIKQAHHNYNRQRLRERLHLETRVNSSFWEQVEREYRVELRELKRTVWKHVME